MEVVGIVAGVVSVLLAGVAIWLAVSFYKLSTANTREVEQAAKGIGASVDRLEKLFDRLYADTFSMMRETVTDMRKHVWPEQTAPDEQVEAAREEERQRADKRVEELKTELSQELSDVMERVGATDAEMGALRAELQPLVERAVTESRMVDVEAREETLREQIRRMYQVVRRRKAVVEADDIVERLKIRGLDGNAVVDEMRRMRDQGDLYWDDEESLGPDTEIFLSSTAARRSRRSRGVDED